MTTVSTLIDKFKRYLMVGGVNTLLNLLIMYIGASLGLHYLLYTPLGYLTTIILSFFMNLHYTFKVHDKHLSRLLGFLSVSLINLGIVEVLEYLLVEHLHLKHWLAIILGMGWYVIFGFLINNFVVYRNTLQTEQPS